MNRLWLPEKSNRRDSTLASILTIKINFEQLLGILWKIAKQEANAEEGMFVEKMPVMWG
jgi:hypothetical protein